jgi:hypothetical protein
MNDRRDKLGFRAVEGRLLVGAIAVGLLAALAEGRLAAGGIAATVGLTIVVALVIAAVYRLAPSRRR